MEESLIIEVGHRPGHVLVTVAGEIDISTVPGLSGRLTALSAGSQPIVVDLTRVSFMGAAGLGTLAVAAAQIRAHGGSLHVAARARIRRLFALTGLDQHIPLAGTLAGAIGAARRAGDMPASGNKPHAGSPDPA